MLERHKVQVSKRGAYKGRGELSEWRMVQRVKKYQLRQWGEDCWPRIFSWFMENDLQRMQGMQEKQTEKEKMRWQQRMKVMTEIDKIKSKGRMDAINSWWASELLVCDCKKSVVPHRMGGGSAAMVRLAVRIGKKRMRKRGWRHGTRNL